MSFGAYPILQFTSEHWKLLSAVVMVVGVVGVGLVMGKRRRWLGVMVLALSLAAMAAVSFVTFTTNQAFL